MVLLTFGVGIGLSATSAHPYAGASAKALAVISALYVAVSLVASFGAGGYVAGRMRNAPAAEEVDEASFRDGAHGFAVWAVSIVLGGMLATSMAGSGLKLAVQTAAVGAAAATSNPETGAAVNRLSTTPIDYAVDRILSPASPPAGGASATSPPATVAGSRTDLAAPIGRVFATSLRTGQLEPRDRATLAATVMQQTGLPQADAEKRVDDAYAELKAAEQKAREVVEQARKAALITAFAVAATLLLACAAACAGAAAGAQNRRERTEILFFGTRRFW
jgi:hypothetical protein